MSTVILWRVFHILTEPVTYTFVSVHRRNNKARADISPQNIRGYTDIFYSALHSRTSMIVVFHRNPNSVVSTAASWRARGPQRNVVSWPEYDVISQNYLLIGSSPSFTHV